jgi:hypothetical protein
MSVSKNSIVIEVIENLNKDIDFKTDLKEMNAEMKDDQFKNVKKFVENNASFYGIPLTVNALERQVKDSLDSLFI